MTRSENPFVRLVPPAPPSLPETNPFRPTSTEDLEPVQAWVNPLLPPQHQASEADDLRIMALAEEARAIKAEMDRYKERYDQVKAALWDAVGRRPVKKDRYGFSFRAFRPWRKVDYKRLEQEYPQVYAQVVSVTEPDENAVGSLYL